MAFFLLTETDLSHQLKEDFPNGNLILQVIQKACPVERYQLISEIRDLGEVYPSYSNGEKDRYVCRPSRENGVYGGYDKRKQAVKMADIYGIEKVWGYIYKRARLTETLPQQRVTQSARIF